MLSDAHRLGRTPLGEGSDCRIYPYLYNTQHPQETDTYAPRAGFERAVPANDWPQTHALRPRNHRDRLVLNLLS